MEDYKRHYPEKFLKKLYAAMRAGDYDEFVNLKYQYFDEGDVVCIEGEDFRKAKLWSIPLHFTCFVDCDLRESNFAYASFNPTGFKNCDLRGADFRSAAGVITMEGCDMREVKWTPRYTFFGAYNDASSPSELENVKLDPDFKEYLQKQGVKFKLSRPFERQFDVTGNVAFGD